MSRKTASVAAERNRHPRLPVGRWLSDHLDAASDSVGKMVAAPLQSSMTILVIAAALCLPLVLLVLVRTIEASVVDIDGSADISVFFQVGADARQISEVQERVRASTDVAGMQLISAAQALEEFQQYSGLGEVLAHIDGNPLPVTLLINPGPELDRTGLEPLLNYLRGHVAVDEVQFDYLWLQRLQAIVVTLQRMVIALASLMGLAVLLVLGNTIRLEIENRRDEVVVVKLVGGTNAFVRRPLLYTGFWYGLVAGLLAWVMTNLVSVFLSEPIARLSDLYFGKWLISHLGLHELALMLLIGAGLGLLGAWAAVARHLAAIEPQ